MRWKSAARIAPLIGVYYRCANRLIGGKRERSVQQAKHDEKAAPTLCSAEELDAAETAFRRTYPAYAQTSALDDLRARDYARLPQT